MPFIAWTNQTSVDVKLLDNDHKKLAILINDLYDGLMDGRARESLEGIFEELLAYTRIHFVHEEELLAEAGYSGAEAHKKEHDHEFGQILDLQERFRSATEQASYLEVMHQLKDWLFVHIRRSDKEFVPYLKAKGIDAILAAWDEAEGAAREKPAARPSAQD